MDTMTTAMTTRQAIALALATPVLGVSLAIGFATTAHAAPTSAPPSPINLTDIADIDALPTCHVEDCSDQPGQVGVWLDKHTGDWYLERGEATWLIVDNTVTPAAGCQINLYTGQVDCAQGHGDGWDTDPGSYGTITR